MNDILNLTGYLQFVIALAFVVGLILLAAMASRRWLESRLVTGRTRRGRRLAIVETLPVDARRRLLLIRRDGVEHLILTNNDGDLLVEGGIPAADAAPGATGGDDAGRTPASSAGTETGIARFRELVQSVKRGPQA